MFSRRGSLHMASLEGGGLHVPSLLLRAKSGGCRAFRVPQRYLGRPEERLLPVARPAAGRVPRSADVTAASPGRLTRWGRYRGGGRSVPHHACPTGELLCSVADVRHSARQCAHAGGSSGVLAENTFSRYPQRGPQGHLMPLKSTHAMATCDNERLCAKRSVNRLSLFRSTILVSVRVPGS